MKLFIQSCKPPFTEASSCWLAVLQVEPDAGSLPSSWLCLLWLPWRKQLHPKEAIHSLQEGCLHAIPQGILTHLALPVLSKTGKSSEPAKLRKVARLVGQM